MDEITTYEANVRDVETVTTEIKMLVQEAQSLALNYAIEIGRRLQEAKEMLPHGEWGNFLKDKVNFSQSTANNFMKIFDEYGDRQLTLFGAVANSQTLGNLPYTKALKLIAIPEDERENFVKENDVANISTRELDKIIKERDELKNAAKKTDELQAKLEKALEKEKKAKADLKAAKENPEISDEVKEKIKAEAHAKTMAAVESEINAATQKQMQAEKNLAVAQSEVDRLKKELKMSNSAVTEFKTVFSSVQDDINKLKSLLNSISADDGEIADKLKKAMNALFDASRC